MKNTIKLKGWFNVTEEIIASGTIRPGMLLELDSDGKVKAHSAAGQNALPMFALEDELQGNDIDDNYSSDDKVQVWFPQRGEQVYAILADGENVDEGDYLESDGAGYLQKHVADAESFESAEGGSITVYPLQIVAQAIQAKDLSGSSGEESSAEPLHFANRVKVRIV